MLWPAWSKFTVSNIWLVKSDVIFKTDQSDVWDTGLNSGHNWFVMHLGSESITFEEFCEMLENLPQSGMIDENTLLKAFQSEDMDGSGSISRAQLYSLLIGKTFLWHLELNFEPDVQNSTFESLTLKMRRRNIL